MKSIKIFSAIVILLSCTFGGCSKKKGCTDTIAFNFDTEAEKDDGSCTYAGLGGNTTIVAKPQHHNNPIYSQANYRDTAYIKFNSLSFPGDNPSAYDLVIAGDSGSDHVQIGGLKTGNYYLYMTGLDTTLVFPDQRVKGGIPFLLNQSSGEVTVVIPVTED